jgi:transposase
MGDRAYDSDPLDQRLQSQYGVQLIAPHKTNRSKQPTQDGRTLRRYRRRWKVERFFAWLHNFRRLVIRWEHYEHNFLGMVQLACILILLTISKTLAASSLRNALLVHGAWHGCRVRPLWQSNLGVHVFCR